MGREEMEGSDASDIPGGDSGCPRNNACSSALGTGVSPDLHFRAGCQSLKWSLRAGAEPGPLSVACEGQAFGVDTGNQGMALAYFGPGFPSGPRRLGAVRLAESSHWSSPPPPTRTSFRFYQFLFCTCWLKSLRQRDFSQMGFVFLSEYTE